MTETIPQLTSLAQAGIAGVCIALVALLAFVIKCVFDNTRATQEIIKQSTETQQKLIDIVGKDAEKTEENTQVLRALQQQLAICNMSK